MLLGVKHDVYKMVSVIAADLNSPAGPIPLERILRKHHQLIAQFRERGLTWEQISRVLSDGAAMGELSRQRTYVVRSGGIGNAIRSGHPMLPRANSKHFDCRASYPWFRCVLHRSAESHELPVRRDLRSCRAHKFAVHSQTIVHRPSR